MPAESEFDILDRIRGRLSRSALLRVASAGEVFSGDDAAVLELPSRQLLFSIDLVVEGVHFDLDLCSLADAGWKAVAVNVSDIAAMGSRPLHAVAGVAAPVGTDLEEVAAGMVEACEAYEVALVGGDLSTGRTLVLSVAITGVPEEGRAPVLRGGARPGDLVWVTGPLGSSAAGLERLRAGAPQGEGDARLASAYRRPQARLREGVAAAAAGATAMIDVSDGLARDLDHIAQASGVGLVLSEVPVAAGATLQQALGGGEDYELAFTAPEAAPVTEAFESSGLRSPVRIGCCTAEGSERTLGGRPLEITGWEHSFGSENR